MQRLRRGRAGGFEEMSTEALRLEVGELRVSSRTGSHGSGHVGTEGLGQGGVLQVGWEATGAGRSSPLEALTLRRCGRGRLGRDAKVQPLMAEPYLIRMRALSSKISR